MVRIRSFLKCFENHNYVLCPVRGSKSTVTLSNVTSLFSHYIIEGVMSSYQIKVPSIVKTLKKEGISVSRFRVHKFLQHFDESSCLLRKPGSGRPSKLTVEDQMRLVEGLKKNCRWSLLVNHIHSSPHGNSSGE